MKVHRRPAILPRHEDLLVAVLDVGLAQVRDWRCVVVVARGQHLRPVGVLHQEFFHT